MGLIAVLAVLGLFAIVINSFHEKPSEIDPRIWDADPVKRAENLKAAMIEYKAGRWSPYTSGLVAQRRGRSSLQRFTGRD